MARKRKTQETSAESLGAFPQITTTCIIKGFNAKKGSQDPRLSKFKVSGSQADTLLGLVDTGEMVQVTISAIQGHLTGTT